MSNKEKEFRAFLCSGVGKGIMIAIFYLLFFGVFALLVGVLDKMEFIAFIYLALFCYFGWKALNKIQPNMFLVLPIGGWVLYYVIKGILAFFVGIFVAPFVIANKIAECIQHAKNSRRRGVSKLYAFILTPC